LIDLVEELDSLVGNVLLEALDRLTDWIGALDPDDAVVGGQRGGLQRRCDGAGE